MDVSPPAIAGPVAARTARVFRFAIEEPRTVRERNKRRLAVAEYLAGWADSSVLAEQRDGRRCWVWLRPARPASIEGTREFLEECPHYVRGTFAVPGSR